MTLRSKIGMLLAEFVGTAVLATAAINISRSQIGIGYFIAIGVGLTLGILVLTIGANSGGHFNPAVTIGMWTLRKIPTLQAIGYVAMQMLGGIAAWKLAEYFTGGDLRNIAGANFEWKVLVAEAVGTFIFTMGIAAAVYQKFEGAKLAAAIGLSLTVGVFVASVASNGLLNPAIALGNQSWARGYVFGPIIGAVLGMNLYALLFAPAKALVDESVESGRAPTRPAPARASEDDEEAETVAVKSTVSRVTTSSSSKKAAAKPAAKSSASKLASKVTSRSSSKKRR